MPSGGSALRASAGTPARFTWRLVVGKFGDMVLDLGCRREHTQRVESGALEDVVQDGEVNRRVVTIVNFVAVHAENLKVSFWHSCDVPSIGISEVQLLRWAMVGGGSFV
jgi:hypothetical protein